MAAMPQVSAHPATSCLHRLLPEDPQLLAHPASCHRVSYFLRRPPSLGFWRDPSASCAVQGMADSGSEDYSSAGGSAGGSGSLGPRQGSRDEYAIDREAFLKGPMDKAALRVVLDAIQLRPEQLDAVADVRARISFPICVPT